MTNQRTDDDGTDTSPNDRTDTSPNNRTDADPRGMVEGGPMSRRTILGGVALGTAALAGCADEDGDPEDDGGDADDDGDDDATGEDESDEGGAPALPSVDDPPDATYIPTHFEAMRHLDPIEAGEFEVEPMVTYPHRFWNVTGREVEAAEPSGSDDVHLMVAVRDPETGAVLPAETGLELNVGLEGESKTPHAPWPMISQEMGFHVGDNVPLGEDGTYEIEVRVGSIDARLTGEFAGRFDEAGRGSFTFEFDGEFRDEVVGGIHYLDEEHWGRHGALANHMAGSHGDHGDGEHGEHGDDDHGGHGDDDHGGHGDDDHGGHGDDDHGGHGDDDHGHGDAHDHRGEERWSVGEGHHRFGTYRRGPDEGEVPLPDDLPGSLLGEPALADAVYPATVLDRGSRFVDDDAFYLAVSPRTPYNRLMLPMMALDYAVERDGEVVAEGSLRDTLDHEVGYHYGTALDELETGDELSVTVETIPNVSRHAGYETAFNEPGTVSYTIELP
ncbi:hypothetical protein J2751_001174 [Halorubrum alkaliphilum]|uniref:DUF7350 domain-containing protein n=1 Tax=Halorubrum alkaliphilum TaxID=261290 RepID=A0A8T4GCJ8_9EURY|nr:hypothetical protein [Halorubrum alkaliphilum]MBP1922168.1 hypothetical protein [Halorubrum alkaliphilum]